MANETQCIFAFCITYGIASTLIKLTVLALYYRVFPTRTVRLGSYVLASLCLGWCIAIELVTIFQCNPIAKTWKTDLDGKCIDNLLFFAGNSVPNCALDLLILTLPIREVLRLQTTRSRKAGIAGVFMLGGIVVVASSIRIYTQFSLLVNGVTNPTSMRLRLEGFPEQEKLTYADMKPISRTVFVIVDSHWAGGRHRDYRCVSAHADASLQTHFHALHRRRQDR